MSHDPQVIPIMRGRLVLVAERYLTARVLVTSGVRALGYPARSCPTGADTLRFLSLHPGGVQCLLADLGLPDMDGGGRFYLLPGHIPGHNASQRRSAPPGVETPFPAKISAGW
jgi:hypothetical protein